VSVPQRQALTITVRLLSDRWHGEGDWPPSPFRLFQALVAGTYGGRWRSEGDRVANDRAFAWLERLDPPMVLAPRNKAAASVQYFVPNNDLDSVGNDPRRSPDIRTAKILKPLVIEGDEPFVFIWEFESELESAEIVATLCERLHTFGRGLDGAFASGTVGDIDAAKAFAENYGGSVARPATNAGGAGATFLPCPAPGSLQSLHDRFDATRGRFVQVGTGRKATIEFRQPPKASMRLVAYDRPSRYFVFEFRELNDSDAFYPIRLAQSSVVAKAVRDLASDRLTMSTDSNLVEKFIVGRGVAGDESRQRVRFVPLPSIGSVFTDPSIRRIIVERPPECPIAANDLQWALSGQALRSVGSIRLVEAGTNSMPFQYGVGRSARRWQTVTPAVLPTSHIRGRNGAKARLEAERSAALDVMQAIRHAGVRPRPSDIRVQREPFIERGLRADAFEPDRFEIGRLYHVDVSFNEEVSGLLSIGDGRWIGLGLMRPVRSAMAIEHSEEQVGDAELDLVEEDSAE
jgi:CRISPR-associated protein Csb2